uniref:Zn(2)-C6 fungal-type domain-containing protein n=1 Tax=Kwoniella pini CBS 10737 TaxID=1296096 RepID=A0A1B9HTX5_9TREE|nr:uncharacterized protein I206_07110 [Kwoniella pini CBS 10737]OCF46723.1 hypothetical protein I206_07110 [Kwoniella pini CBS 10737]
MSAADNILSSSSTAASQNKRQSSPLRVSPVASTSSHRIRQDSTSSPPESSSGPKQRTRIQRACDACRNKRLKCEYERGSSTCIRCQKSSVLCQAIRPAPTDDRPRAKRHRSQKVSMERRDTRSPTPEDDDSSDESPYSSQGLEPRFLGSTSLSGLTALTLSLLPNSTRSDLNNLDDRYAHFRVALRSDDEAVLVGRGDMEDDRTRVKKKQRLNETVNVVENTGQRLGASVLKEGVIQSLIHSYRLNILPLSPILSLAELCSIEPSLGYALQSEHIGPPPPNPLPKSLTRLAVCTLAALSRQVPRHIYHSLFAQLTATLNGAEGSRLMRTSSLGNVQVLLLLSSSAEMHSSNTDQGGGLSWLRSGLAIRMAQDIGLHREIAQDTIPMQQINRRRRVWAACIISDRWYAISFGRPMAINLFDCDAAGPSIYADDIGHGVRAKEAPYQVHAEMAKVSFPGSGRDLAFDAY